VLLDGEQAYVAGLLQLFHCAAVDLWEAGVVPVRWGHGHDWRFDSEALHALVG